MGQADTGQTLDHHQHVVNDSLDDVVLMVRGLCLRHQTVSVLKGLQPTPNDSLQQLRQERQIRCGPVVLHLAGVETPVFLEQWTHNGLLEL